MEAAVVGGIVKIIVGPALENLISLLKKEFSLIKDVKKDVAELLSKLSAIQAVLDEAEEKQINSKPITDWLRKLKDATYDAEDVLDALSLNIPQQAVQFSSTSSGDQVSPSFSFCLNPKNLLSRRKIAKKIKKIIRAFDMIAVEKAQFQFSTPVVSPSKPQFNKDRETTSLIKEPQIYGRDENKKKIVDILVNDFVNQDHVSVYPIVGMGGLGKTTLAQSIFNDERIKRYFQLKIWVCVSEPFDLDRVLKAIVESSGEKASDLLTLQAVSNKVERILMEQRNLIVLDDVWTENRDDWNNLKSVFRGQAKGSFVVLTTRSATVAAMTGSLSASPLSPLSDNDCFSLFINCALGDMDEEANPNLVAIGNEIAKKCKGVPLVAKSLGSLLRFKTDEKQWEHVRDSDIWTLSETAENTIIAALRLSYYHLPSRMKQCFAYCSLFNKEKRMGKIKLIYLWIANGFIQSEGRMKLEDVGDELFNELVRLSFFEVAVRDDCGDIKSCNMHALMYDIASSVASNDCLTSVVGEIKHVPKSIRHLSIVGNSPQSQIDLESLVNYQPLSLRTLSFRCSIDFHRFQFSSTLRVLDLSYRSIKTLPPSVCALMHLRYLDLSYNLLTSLPESLLRLTNLQLLDLGRNKGIATLPLAIGNLKHLRYFNFSYCASLTIIPDSIGNLEHLQHLILSGCSGFTTLPDSMGNLENLRHLNLVNCIKLTSLPESISGLRYLQSLVLQGCIKLKALPQNMKNMRSLRHLDVSFCSEMSKIPVGIGELKGLLTLPWFVVSRPSDVGDSGAGAGISELQGLKQLTGMLCINGLENIRDREDAKKANLRSKKTLTRLQLLWSNLQEVDNSKEVLEGLLPLPPNLQELVILDYKWEASFPEELFVQNLKSLRKLSLVECDKLVSLPDGLLQNLTSLETLHIIGWKSLKRLGNIGIQGGLNPNTTSLSSGLQSSLQQLYIDDCPELVFSEEFFEHLNGLNSLSLHALPQLTVLPQGIQHLPMLQFLYIGTCLNLRMLPECIKHLYALQSLTIEGCHEELHKRYVMDTEDWHLISHIRYLRILKQKKKNKKKKKKKNGWRGIETRVF